jgi:WD40 repeat protein
MANACSALLLRISSVEPLPCKICRRLRSLNSRVTVSRDVLIICAISSWVTGHQGPVFSAAFSPDGKRVVTASADQTARVYIVDLDDLLNWVGSQLPIDSK